MKAKEFISELGPRKKKVVEPAIQLTASDRAYDSLMSLKEESTGKFPCNTYQLFMPRPHLGALSRYDKHLQNISNSYRYDKENPTEISQTYQDWADKSPDQPYKPVEEGAPIIAARSDAGTGYNKPTALLWTSTTTRSSNGTYTSDWVKTASSINKSWVNDTGYLYKMSPNATILHLDNDYDAEYVYDIFRRLDKVVEEPYTPGKYEDQETKFRKYFPWNEIAKHFDGVHHSGGAYQSHFMYGWDCESTAIFNPDILTLLGEVSISGGQDEEDEN